MFKIWNGEFCDLSPAAQVTAAFFFWDQRNFELSFERICENYVSVEASRSRASRLNIQVLLSQDDQCLSRLQSRRCSSHVN